MSLLRIVYERMRLLEAEIKVGFFSQKDNGKSQVLDEVYETGRKITEDFEQMMEFVFDDYLPQWNYTAKPQMF